MKDVLQKRPIEMKFQEEEESIEGGKEEEKRATTLE